MILKAKLLSIVALLFIAAGLQTPAHAWSLNPFSSEKKTEPTRTVAHKQSSAWDKTVSGTKNFFNKTGETLGLKKPEKKYKAAYARPRTVSSKKETSWFGGMFKPEEEPKPKDVAEWMRNTKQITP